MGSASRQLWFVPALLGVASLLVSGAADASDGVLEINQTCAVNTGCFAGDAAGFPVEITASAPATSFVLTSELDVSDPNLDGISFAAPATIDLNGFEVAGPVVCSGFGAGVTCGAGSGRGIVALSGASGTVRNGRITGFGNGAVVMSSAARVEDVTVELNGGSGISTSFDSVVRSSIARQNRGDGIIVGSFSTLEGVVAAGNYLLGINAGGSVLTASTSRGNGTFGVFCGSSCVIRDGLIASNGGDGIRLVGGNSVVTGTSSRTNGGVGIYCLSNPCNITASQVSDNGDDGINAGENSLVSNALAEMNDGDGIQVGPGSTVIGSTASQNEVAGIRAGRGCTIRDNAVRNNTSVGGTGIGIHAEDGCTVDGNSVRSNDGLALELVSTGGFIGYANNVLTDNNGGDANAQVGGGAALDQGGNICGNPIACP